MGMGRTRPLPKEDVMTMKPAIRRPRSTGRLRASWKLEPLKIRDDPIRGIVNIEGIDYSYELFRSFGVGNTALRRGDVFTIVERENGIITLRRLDDADPRRSWFS